MGSLITVIGAHISRSHDMAGADKPVGSVPAVIDKPVGIVPAGVGRLPVDGLGWRTVP